MTLKTRINIVAVISIILVATILLILGKFSENLVEIRFQEASLAGKSALWKKIISSQYDQMETNTNIITRDRDTLKAIKNVDKAAIEGMDTTYTLISSNNIASKLQITDLNGQVLFSAPDSFEGSTRKILHSRVLTEGKVMRGIERDDDNKLYISLSFPLYYRGKPIGVASYMRDLQGAIEDFKNNDNSDTFIINDNGHPESSTDKNLLDVLDFDLPALGSQSMAVAKHNGVIHSIAMQPLLGIDDNPLAHLVSVKNQTESYQAQQSLSLFSYLSIIVTLLISAGGLTWYLRKNFKPLDTVVEMMNRISKGDLRDHTESMTRKDEIGQLIHAMSAMTINFRRIVTEVYMATDNIDQTSQEISTGNDNLSQRTQEQTSSLEETAASMEEMTGTVKQNADSAQLANQLANSTRNNAEQGKQVVDRTINAMSEINNSSTRIADITSTIDSIAFQTNLLALNAAIEAARAGEHGRGFAVVANEVRTLAKRSAEAAKEIKKLIEDSVEKVKIGTDLVDESGQTLASIVNDITKVADLIAEIDIASEEQASGINQINNAVTHMDGMTQQNVHLVEASSSSNSLLQQQATRLTELMEFFQLGQASSNITKENHQHAIGRDI